MNSKTIFVALSASLLCGWLSVPVALAAEPDATPAPAAATVPAAPAAAQAGTPAATPDIAPATAVQDAAAAKTEAATAASAAASTAAVAKPAAPAGDDEIICKKQEVFGSRVRKTQICRTKKEWQMESQAAKDFSRGVSKGNSVGPGGQALPVGN